MGFDRALSKAVLDAGLAVAAEGGDRAALTERLSTIVSKTEAKGRTGAHVARTWVTPAPRATGFIAWAVENRELDPGRALLHFGALLATEPFVVPIAAAASKQVERDGAVDPDRMKRELRRAVGDDDAAAKGIDNVLDTFRSVGLLLGTAERPLWGRLSVPKTLGGWLTHALLLARHASELEIREWRTAPELGVLGRRPTGGAHGYPLLELHQRGGRMVAAERS
ncbi:MAG: hypothetical protein H0W25_01360 [Acidimicrobiia bacterium]|nr:hypothetical protein [Acidimicrobiia bacterium]